MTYGPMQVYVAYVGDILFPDAQKGPNISDGQVSGQLLRVKGKGWQGMGQGTDFETLIKPLPT